MKYLFHMVVYDYIKQFNFNKLIDNKPGAYSTEFIQANNNDKKMIFFFSMQTVPHLSAAVCFWLTTLTLGADIL